MNHEQAQKADLLPIKQPQLQFASRSFFLMYSGQNSALYCHCKMRLQVAAFGAMRCPQVDIYAQTPPHLGAYGIGPEFYPNFPQQPFEIASAHEI